MASEDRNEKAEPAMVPPVANPGIIRPPFVNLSAIVSLWLPVTLVPAEALMSLVVIPREERYLERRFPSEYLAYKASVRRWL
ncbi:isoprenylcysteine carboxylmethyltransferase family protein [Paraburkholderia sp. BR10954]|uniref:isoprenylcysteine carboxylmethyltransferase family protein n=1 Tax=Paraburkholderia sp. BR10954 TaxID=3236995 RepID=UPI0034D2E67B